MNNCTTQSHDPTGGGGGVSQNTKSTPHSREISLSLAIGRAERDRERKIYKHKLMSTKLTATGKPKSTRHSQQHHRYGTGYGADWIISHKPTCVLKMLLLARNQPQNTRSEHRFFDCFEPFGCTLTNPQSASCVLCCVVRERACVRITSCSMSEASMQRFTVCLDVS